MSQHSAGAEQLCLPTPTAAGQEAPTPPDVLFLPHNKKRTFLTSLECSLVLERVRR